jgi:hypothetical protein
VVHSVGAGDVGPAAFFVFWVDGRVTFPGFDEFCEDDQVLVALEEMNRVSPRVTP